MKKIVFLLLLNLLGTSIINAQAKLECDGKVEFVGAFPNNECPNDLRGKKCAVIDVFIPLDNVDFRSDYIVDKKRIIGGYRLFVSVPERKAQNVRVTHNDFSPIDFSFGGKDNPVMGIKQYKIDIKISEDKNAGKAFIIVDCNVPNANVRITGDHGVNESHQIKGTRLDDLHFEYGKYTCTITADGYIPETYHVDLTGKTELIQAMLKTVNGTLVVKRESDVNLTIDGKDFSTSDSISLPVMDLHKVTTSWGTYSKTETINVPSEGKTIDMSIKGSLRVKTNALNPHIEIETINGTVPPNTSINENTYYPGFLGKYRLNIKKSGYESKSFDVEVGVNQKKSESYRLAHVVSPYYFVEYTAAMKAPIGITMGFVEHWGLYVTAQTSYPSYKNAIKAKSSNATDEDMEFYEIESVSNLSEAEYKIMEKKTNFRGSLTGGPIFRMKYWAYLFAGAGYGTFTNIYQESSSETYYKGEDLKGVEAEMGLLLKIRAWTLSGRYTHLFGSNTFGDISIGIGLAVNLGY